MTIQPVNLRLSFWEASNLKDFFLKLSTVKITADTRNEVIILLEFSEKFYTKCFAHGLKSQDKLVKYCFPLSVARILHHRLLHEPYEMATQYVLSKLDQELTNRSLKPFTQVRSI